MSSQGTGSTQELFASTVFLEAWGDWARNDKLGGSIRQSSLFAHASLAGLGWLFTDDEMVVIDCTIAKLSKHQKKILKRVHLYRREVYGQDQQIAYGQAVRAFTYALENASADGKIEMVLLDTISEV